MKALEGKSVLVVGGSSGIGRAAAVAAADEGAVVTAIGRSTARLDAAGLGAATRVALDATDENALRAFFSARPAFDHVVFSAGAGGRGLVAEQDPAEAAAAFEGKFWAYYRLARTARIVEGGSLTSVSGVIGQKPAPGAALISAINAAMEGLTRGLAVDLAPTRVNTVCPGLIDTPMWDRMGAEARDAMYARAAKALPVGRIGQPADVAAAILFLMTNPFATGMIVTLDGGAVRV
jgi:NAD(P)-dependent dehydrogenase (short-subunit alcohol dehydrogenase family)